MENLPGLDADNFSLGKKFSNVRHSQAVEEVHQNDDGEEDKEDEEDECQEGEGASAVYWQAEMQKVIKIAELHFCPKKISTQK